MIVCGNKNCPYERFHIYRLNGFSRSDALFALDENFICSACTVAGVKALQVDPKLKIYNDGELSFSRMRNITNAR